MGTYQIQINEVVELSAMFYTTLDIIVKSIIKGYIKIEYYKEIKSLGIVVMYNFENKSYEFANILYGTCGVNFEIGIDRIALQNIQIDSKKDFKKLIKSLLNTIQYAFDLNDKDIVDCGKIKDIWD